MHKGIVPLCWAIGHIAQPWLGICCPIETEFYYLQSRYYDPATGRFLNADALMSTGQGFIGYNMFAYCENNPVNGFDPCGTCFHRWDFWNDCENCGGATFGQKIYNSAKKIKNHHVLQAETQNVIIQQQTQLIKNACQQSLERNAYRIHTQIDSQYQQDMGTIRVAKYLAENPMIAIDIAADTTSVVTWYTGLCILLVPLNVPVVGQMILSALGGAATFWSLGRNSVTTWRNVGEIFYGEEY